MLCKTVRYNTPSLHSSGRETAGLKQKSDVAFLLLARSLNRFLTYCSHFIPTRVLAWRIPGTGEPGGLPSMGSHRVRHDWNDVAVAVAVAATFYRRRQWHPTPVFLPGKSHGWRSLEGCSPWGRWGSDTTEWLHFHFHALKKEMATHSSVPAWRIPGMAEPGELPSTGSHRVGHNWSDLAEAAPADFGEGLDRKIQVVGDF